MNNRELRLGSKLHEGRDEKPTEVFWILMELGHSYRFYIENPEHEVFFEHDELIAFGEAYKDKQALSVMDVLDKLEEESPDYTGIRSEDGRVEMIRKRISKPGVLLEVDGRMIDFVSDTTLSKSNFLDIFDKFWGMANGGPALLTESENG